MMSVTWTRSPPSCAAMLPQKSSAATTLSFPEALAEPVPPQPATATAIAAMTTATVAIAGRIATTLTDIETRSLLLKKLDPASKPRDLGQLPIPGNDRLDVLLGSRGSEDQSVRHPQRPEARPQVGGAIRDRNVDGKHHRDQGTEEA